MSCLLVLLVIPAFAQAQSYNWRDRTPPPGLRSSGRVMAYDSDRGVAVMFGGSYYDGTTHYYSDTWEWDGAAGTWTQRSNTGPSPRYGHALAYDSARGVTVLFGGAGSGGYRGDTWEWNGTTGTWMQRSSTGPSPRYCHAMAYDSVRGVTVLFGGRNASGYLGDTWEWNSATGTWAQRSGTGPSSRYIHAMAYDNARGVTVLFGGANAGSYFGDTWEWDGATGTWTQLASTGPSARDWHAMAYDTARGVTVLFGGTSNGSQDLGDTWEWDGTAGTWTQRSNIGPSPRAGHAMAYDTARSVTVLFGDASNGAEGGTWEWNGAAGTWLQRSSTGPSPRTEHAMAYDSARSVAVLFGGIATSYLGDTWEWNGTTRIWTRRSITGPSPRQKHAMVYDSARGVTVLFGGQFYNAGWQTCQDTWEWDGVMGIWTQRSSSGPPPRHEHAMAYDSRRGIVVLFGGLGKTSPYYLGDTWEWDGANGTWTQRSSTGPSVRALHAMAYDGARGVTVLFGGGNASSYLNDTWEWNGTTGVWTQRSSTGPSPRAAHAMNYDSARGVSVLFGGAGAAGPDLGDTWEWNGTTGSWMPRLSTGPAARDAHAMAYDSTRGVTVLFAGFVGYTNNLFLGDTWEYQVLPPADFDRSGHVDADDLQIFAACATGPALQYDTGTLPAGCSLVPDNGGHIAADFDHDGDVDQEDFGIFQRCYSGEGNPADPNCAN